MANWTSAELAADVLRRLGVTASGQSATAEDLDVVTDAYASIYPRLRMRGVAPWGSEAIEEEAQVPLSQYVASQVYSAWGFTGDKEATIRIEGKLGLQELYLASSSKRTCLPVRVTHF